MNPKFWVSLSETVLIFIVIHILHFTQKKLKTYLKKKKIGWSELLSLLLLHSITFFFKVSLMEQDVLFMKEN